jgi:hypothetical protein
VHSVGQHVLSRNWGIVAACQAAGLKFNSASQASVPLLRNQSHYPDGDRVLRHAFSGTCAFPRKDILTPSPGHKQIRHFSVTKTELTLSGACTLGTAGGGV